MVFLESESIFVEDDDVMLANRHAWHLIKILLLFVFLTSKFIAFIRSQYLHEIRF